MMFLNIFRKDLKMKIEDKTERLYCFNKIPEISNVDFCREISRRFFFLSFIVGKMFTGIPMIYSNSLEFNEL